MDTDGAFYSGLDDVALIDKIADSEVSKGGPRAEDGERTNDRVDFPDWARGL